MDANERRRKTEAKKVEGAQTANRLLNLEQEKPTASEIVMN